MWDRAWQGEGGRITAATDVLAGQVMAGDHQRCDTRSLLNNTRSDIVFPNNSPILLLFLKMKSTKVKNPQQFVYIAHARIMYHTRVCDTTMSIGSVCANNNYTMQRTVYGKLFTEDGDLSSLVEKVTCCFTSTCVPSSS